MTTPVTSCINGPEFSEVYVPSEDSYLFLDALEADYEFLSKLKPSLTLEVGSGSGVISAFLCSSIQKPLFHICTDISPTACHASLRVLNVNVPSTSVAYDVINCSLATPLLSRLYHSVDLIMFNPPYVPTTLDEYKAASSTIVASWSGGPLGRKVIDPFLYQAYNLLSPNGCIYLLLSKDNCPDEVHLIMQKLSGGKLHAKEILHRRAHNEFLTVFRYS
ncbi:Methyltransferase N6AMT1 [Schistosoma japonicum]|nr:Methyltransferase N6AMT1 [Schistosoma japonicum]KAH8870910.1 Methyltransferase N6AMT1 [Schistosoma japonicum]